MKTVQEIMKMNQEQLIKEFSETPKEDNIRRCWIKGLYMHLIGSSDIDLFSYTEMQKLNGGKNETIPFRPQ